MKRYDDARAAGAILDEVQYVPGLLPYLKLRVDERRADSGRWLLTGSQQFGLKGDVSESLAGRVALFDLLPFSLLEHPPTNERALADGHAVADQVTVLLLRGGLR